MIQASETPAAVCLGVKVPPSPMLNDKRIERINAARYEGQEIAGALEVVRPGDRVLELGAGLGIVGAVVAHNASPRQVMSFEANPALIPHIKALHAMNGLEDKVTLRHAVLMSDPEAPPSLPFHIRNSYLGSSLIDSDSRETTRVDVPTAAYAEVKDSFAPDVLIMDIEGGELDFLRHADLSGIRAVVIEFHPEAYGRAGTVACKSLLKEAGFTKVPDHCTRTVWTCTKAPVDAAPEIAGGWSHQIKTMEGATVVPPTDTGLIQSAGILTADGQYCPEGALWRNGRALTIQPAAPGGPVETRPGTWLWGGVLWMHFGHFMVESLARAWALDHLDAEIDGVLFIPKRPRNGTAVLDYQQALFDSLGAGLPLACAARPERVERLIVPGQGFGLGAMARGTPLFRDAMRSRFGRDVPAEGPEKLYISRSQLPAGRGTLIGETELESHLAAEGYTIYHPQNHDIQHQIATYKAARQIVAAEGSALHLVAMLAAPEAEIAMIVRRPSGATRNIEAHLASFTGRAPSVISQLTRSWKPKGSAKPRSWMGELDMPALQFALACGGFIAPPTTTIWQPLDPDGVAETLGENFEEVA